MNQLKPGNAVLFMKVGKHAQETLESILARKRKEIEDGGFAMWGYGGSTCHPLSMVRPFAETFKANDGPIKLVMEVMDSKHFAEPVVADQYSIDGEEWQDIDTRIHKVLGSRYALFIDNIREEKLDLPISYSKVALGPSAGRRGDVYIQGRVDKACLIYDPTEESDRPVTRPINLVADLVSPYAALLRNKH